MHRALNIKHRIVRRIDVGKAPLATFDTIDLGDGDTKLTRANESEQDENKQNKPEAKHICQKKFAHQDLPKSEIIGGNNSKKSLSQAGGGKDEKRDVKTPNIAGDDKKNPDETGITASSKGSQSPLPPAEGKDANAEKDRPPVSDSTPSSEVLTKEVKELKQGGSTTVRSSHACASSGLNRQGTIGRVSIPIRKQDSVSSSSSSEACTDSQFNFSATRPSIAHLDSADAGPNLPDSAKDRGTISSLIPDNIDPSQILSPSKRKAYEKRIERLKVTTSPIARPRSTAPINVVTLDEYANLSSPEASPASPSVLQDKLKITLPTDEFSSKPRTPKHLSAKRHDSEDTCFEFSEEILFRCTKSALVVEEDGNLPLSPRRVLIPPTITPASSPKLSSSPNLSKDGGARDVSTSATPKLIYFKDDVNAQTFFGKTVDQTENENWADFPDSRVNFEKADSECSEKEEKKSSSYLAKELSQEHQLSVTFGTDDEYVQERTESNETQVNSAVGVTSPSGIPSSDSCSEVSGDDDHAATNSPYSNTKIQATYNIKENSEDVLVLEIIQHKPEHKNENEKTVDEEDLQGDYDDENKETDVPEPVQLCSDGGLQNVFDNLSLKGEHLNDLPSHSSDKGDLPKQPSIPLDLKETTCTAEIQPFPDATCVLDTSTASTADHCVDTSSWFLPPSDNSTANNCVSPSKATPSLTEELLLIDSSPFDQAQSFPNVSPFDQQPEVHEPGQVTLTPFSDLPSASPTDLISFSLAQNPQEAVEEQ